LSSIIERYSADAADYARYWAPVLEPTAHAVLDQLAEFAAGLGRRPRILDIGAGTGSLALAAWRRWPDASIVVSDAADGMVRLAERRAIEAGANSDGRLIFVTGPADALPLADESVDAVISSFVLQLVPDRFAALREARRLLAPSGLLAYVTWLDRDARQPFRPAEEFDEAVLDLAIDEPETADEQHAGDVPSARAAEAQLRRAGFRDAVAREEELVYHWTPDSYLEYKLAYDERSLLSLLDADQRRELEANARRRLGRLRPAEFRWHAPVVFAHARRPG
jgi:SAM-dependent methyltransferase